MSPDVPAIACGKAALHVCNSDEYGFKLIKTAVKPSGRGALYRNVCFGGLPPRNELMPGRIEDYAVIGNCETVALVGLDGSIDWLCIPRFDRQACFAALLGDKRNGRWLIAPENDQRRISRRYVDDTLILETTFDTPDG